MVVARVLGGAREALLQDRGHEAVHRRERKRPPHRDASDYMHVLITYILLKNSDMSGCVVRGGVGLRRRVLFVQMTCLRVPVGCVFRDEFVSRE